MTPKRRPPVADFQGVRAVFTRWDAPYQKLDQNMVELSDGQLNFQPHPLHVYRTGDGILLLLITPLPGNPDGNDEDAAREKVAFARSIIVALIGRNAAYEHEFDMTIECGPRTVSNPSPVFTAPVDEKPSVNEDGFDLIEAALEELSRLDEATQARIRLALRWYQRSLGDYRLVHDSEEGQVDDFINCWLALETLAMQGTTNITPIKRILGEIHGLGRQETGELFPIGRIYGLRNSILHEGHIGGFNAGLIRFMTDAFSDLLLHVLGLPSGDNTRKYLDGSARELL